MELDIKNYKRRPFYVEGVEVTPENIMLVAEWCNGEVRKAEKAEVGTSELFIKVPVKKAANVRQTQAFPGDMVLKAGRGFKVYPSDAFNRSFEPSNGKKS